MKRKPDNKVEKFKEFISSNKWTSLLVILGVVIISLGKVTDSIEKMYNSWDSFGSDSELIVVKNMEETILKDIQKIREYYNQYNSNYLSIEQHKEMISTIQDIEFKLKEIEKNEGSLKSMEINSQLKSLKDLMLRSTFEIIELYENSRSQIDESVRQSAILNCNGLLRLCRLPANSCNDSEKKVILSTLSFFEKL